MAHDQTNVRKPVTTPVSGDFVKVLRYTVLFTFAFFLVCILLNYQGQEQTELYKTCETMLKMGFGSIIGLFGGKIS